MPDARVVPACERMDRIFFSRQAETRDRLSHIGAYCCPRCGGETEFRTSDFEKLVHCSNFPESVRSHFDTIRPVNRADWQLALDFRCAGCGAPARLIYEAGGEYAMGCRDWHVLEIVESEESG